MTEVPRGKASTGALEALLFAYGEPMKIEKIAALAHVSAQEAQALVDELWEELKKDGRGLTLLTHQGAVQLATKPIFHAAIEELLKAEVREELSPAALETLAIVAYTGPAPRSIIDYVRGVNSSFMLRTLSIRGLVSRTLDPSRPYAYLYEASVECLKHLGVERISDLPEYEKFHALVGRYVETPSNNDALHPPT